MVTQVYKVLKKDIAQIPFHLGLDALPGIEAHSSWLLPQALAKLNKEMKLVRNADGSISPSATLVAFRDSLGSEEEADYYRNLLEFLTLVPRGQKVLGLLKPLLNPQYSALVPLALSAFKQYRGVQYSEWDWTDPLISVFVDKTLLASTYIEVPEFTKDELLEFRDTASIIKTTGGKRTSNQMTSIYSVGDITFDSLPALAKVMLLQTWVAAPNIRMDLQILDPTNPDNMPEPLIPVDIKVQEVNDEPTSKFKW